MGKTLSIVVFEGLHTSRYCSGLIKSSVVRVEARSAETDRCWLMGISVLNPSYETANSPLPVSLVDLIKLLLYV